MAYQPDIHHRRSIRLKRYDYSTAGAYFLTICTRNRECLFGEVVDGEMRSNEAGRRVQTVWDEIPVHYPGIDIDAFIVMPNHVHGILFINDPIQTNDIIIVGARFIAPRFIAPDGSDASDEHVAINCKGAMNCAPTLGMLVRAFKARCTHAFNRIRNNSGAPVWQRNYYERVIRNDDELCVIREYIARNPTQWAMDKNNPNNIP